MARKFDLDTNTLLEAIDRMQSSFAVYDNDFRLVYANAAARTAWPTLYSELANGRSQLDAVRGEIRRLFPDLPEDGVAEAAAYTLEAQETGEPREIHATDGRIFRTHHEKVGNDGTVAIGIDLTDLKAHEKKLQRLAKENFRLANKDELTGLSNRRHFMSVIDDLVGTSDTDDTSFSLVLIDLDGFKLVNDLFGHPVGDELLKETAGRLRERVGPDAILARLGGDEFGVVLVGNHEKDVLQNLGNNICSDLAEPFKLGTEQAQIAASVGVASYPISGKSRSVLFERADFALYHAKQSGKAQAVQFSKQHELDIKRRAALSLRLREADFDSEIHVEFQPILDAKGYCVIGVEALARWTNPSLGPVSPAEFIPLLEQSGQMSRVTPIVLRKALASARDWPSHVFLSVNLSAVEVSSLAYAEELVEIIESSGFPMTRTVIEITESAMIRDTDNVHDVLTFFRNQGIRIALDDFGTGFSSLNHLATMPIDILKVYRSFLQSIEHVSASADVLRAICDLGRNLNIVCIAEGVETDAQLETAQRAGIDSVQGFLLSTPLSRRDAKTFLDRMKTRVPFPDIYRVSRSS